MVETLSEAKTAVFLTAVPAYGTVFIPTALVAAREIVRSVVALLSDGGMGCVRGGGGEGRPGVETTERSREETDDDGARVGGEGGDGGRGCAAFAGWDWVLAIGYGSTRWGFCFVLLLWKLSYTVESRLLCQSAGEGAAGGEEVIGGDASGGQACAVGLLPEVMMEF
ncbi:hypothetical protein B0H13DRAFT_2272655 [Mycena leptocephala]|nr:hypothetical protein B0H13DRAFT_2272655 [Mycena leptocephala]